MPVRGGELMAGDQLDLSSERMELATSGARPTAGVGRYDVRAIAGSLSLVMVMFMVSSCTLSSK